jgi:hypothetical protein
MKQNGVKIKSSTLGENKLNHKFLTFYRYLKIFLFLTLLRWMDLIKLIVCLQDKFQDHVINFTLIQSDDDLFIYFSDAERQLNLDIISRVVVLSVLFRKCWIECIMEIPCPSVFSHVLSSKLPNRLRLHLVLEVETGVPRRHLLGWYAFVIAHTLYGSPIKVRSVLRNG